MIEEELRNQLIQVLSAYSQGGMSLGSIYYILKDVFKDLEQNYIAFIQQQQEQKMNEEIEKELEEENEDEEYPEPELEPKTISNLEEGETLEYE
jgi:hypothetical protein